MASKVFITDNLTRENQYVLYKARQFRKEGKIFAAWSDVGKLKVRQRQDSPTTVIRSLNDLLKLVEGGAERGGARRRGTTAEPADAEGYRRIVTRSSGKASKQ